jgi:cytoskeletal protein RodZ
MPISTVIGVLAALIGSTATLLAAWVYIRSKRPEKRELLRGLLAIIVIMAFILGLAVLISRVTRISINGQETIPVPGLPAPASPPMPASTATLMPTPTSTKTPPPTLAPTPTSGLTPTPTAGGTPTPPPTPTSAPTP